MFYFKENAANLELVELPFAQRPDPHLLTATDGHQGIELARTCVPQLILMDINMPSMDGIECLKQDSSTQAVCVRSQVQTSGIQTRWRFHGGLSAKDRFSAFAMDDT